MSNNTSRSNSVKTLAWIFGAAILFVIVSILVTQLERVTDEANIRAAKRASEELRKETNERYRAQARLVEREIGGLAIGPDPYSNDEIGFLVCGKDNALYVVFVARHGLEILEKRRIPMLGKVLQEDGTFLFYPMPHGETLEPIRCAVEVPMPSILGSAHH